MKGRLLERFRDSASYSQLILFDQLQKEYEKGNVSYQQVYIFVVFCSATIVKNEATKELLR